MKDMNLEQSIKKIAQGVHHFQSQVYKEKKALFKSLAQMQEPKILFITCSDSRIDPSLITQTEPGDMFLIHNAGNIVPPHGTAYGGTAASIEYAVSVLNVEHVIICGHSACGAMTALLNPDAVNNLPAVKYWLAFAESTRAILDKQGSDMTTEERVDYCIHMNIPVQLAHLRTLPSVAAKFSQNEIKLHGWVYDIESGNIEVYNAADNTFISFSEAYALELEPA